MAFELIKTSLAKIIHPADTVFEPLIVVILLCSILIKCYMYLYNRSISRKIKSEAMMATAADSLSDTDVLAEAKQENSLIANMVRDERDAAAKAEDKFFAGKTEEKEQSKE